MEHGRGALGYGQQLSLLAEDAICVEVRMFLQRGEIWATGSFTLTRPDDSWLACEVRTCASGPSSVGAAMAELTDTALGQAFEMVGPF